MNAWALLVVSSDVQAESLPDQRAWAEATCASHDWSLGRVFEGVSSGKDGPRRLLRELIAELRALTPAERPEWLLMIRADRLGRGRIAESQIAQHEIIDLGVRIWTRSEGELKLDSAMDQLIAAVRATTAAFENEVRRDKMLAVHRSRREKGLPVGYKRPYGVAIGSDGADVAVDGAADVVRRIFALRIAGQGYDAICREIAPSAPPHRLRSGDVVELRWTPRRIRSTLANRSYIGPVVDEVTFYRAQAAAAGVARAWPSRRHPWPLSGSLRCYCGYLAHGRMSGRSHDRRYYVCQARWNHDGKLRFIRAERIEEQFVALLYRLVDQPHEIAAYHAAATNAPSPVLLERALAEARAEVASINRQRDRVWELNAAGTVRDGDVQERLDALAVKRDAELERISTLEGQRAAAAASSRQIADTAALVEGAAKLYAGASDEQRRELTRAVALDLGGLCAEPDGRLTVRTPAAMGALRRQTM